MRLLLDRCSNEDIGWPKLIKNDLLWAADLLAELDKEQDMCNLLSRPPADAFAFAHARPSIWKAFVKRLRSKHVLEAQAKEEKVREDCSRHGPAAPS